MRPGNRAVLVALLLALIPGTSSAEPPPGNSGLVDLAAQVRELVPFLLPAAVAPQAVATGNDTDPSVDPGHLETPELLEHDLRAALATPLSRTRLTVVGGIARLGDYTLGSAEVHHGHVVVLEGDADIHGRLEGNLVTLDGNIIIHRGGHVVGDVLAINGTVRDADGTISGVTSTLEPRQVAPAPRALPQLAGRLAGLAGLLLTFVALGFALVTFGRPNLEIVSDTVSHSFGRAFLAGILAQVLLLPTFGMLVVGLVLTVAGALLVPFAALVYLILAVTAVVGGLLAVGHAIGETMTRRQLARGVVVSPNSYRYVLVGMLAMTVPWLAWALIGWVPVAGALCFVIAALATWLVATVGFGAALLSRGGIREEFSGRLLPPAMMTDEYLWATPQLGVPAVTRPPKSPE